MKKTIVYKIRIFPSISETFIVSNIVTALNNGYNIKIIADNFDRTIKPSQPFLYKKHDLFNKVYTAGQPAIKQKRYVKALRLFINPIYLYFFIKYCFLKREISLKYLFILHFYNQFRNNSIFHVHFANREKPLFDLKKIGFIKSKIIITFHGFDVHFLPDGNDLNNILLDFTNLVSNITVNSLYLKHELLKKGFLEQNIEIIPMGIDTVFFDLKDKVSCNNKVLKIISIGRLKKIKGHIFGVKAVMELINKGYKVEYSIIGDGEEYNNLISEIVSNELKSDINLLGIKNQEEIKNRLAESDVFLFPSTVDATGRREAFGVVSLEAQAMGLPVVGFNSGGFPETIVEGKTGFAVPDEDVIALAEKLEFLINNPEILKQMGENARVHVKNKFTLEKTMKLFLKFYK